MGHHENLRYRVFGKKLGRLLLASITTIMLCMPLAPAFAMPQSLSASATESEPCSYAANSDVSANADMSRTVWVSRKGTKYHYSSTCSGMKNPIAMTLQQALDAGKSPCSKCVHEKPITDPEPTPTPDPSPTPTPTPDPSPTPDPDPEPAPGPYDNLSTRLAGEDAVQTASIIASEAFGDSTWAILARDDDFADAMSATGLAGALNAPIVLTDRHGLSSEAATTLSELGVENVYIIGGQGAMPGAFESQLRAIGVSHAERIFGNEAYDTLAVCADRIAKLDNACDYAIVTYGQNFQDALSMSSFAYKYHVPIFLQTYGSNSSYRHLTDDALAMLNGTGAYAQAKVFVAGGAGAVSQDSAEHALDGGLHGGQRLWGDSGYDTSEAIAEFMTDQHLLSAGTICLASGALKPGGSDALAGAALAGKAGGVMLLTNGNADIESTDTTTVDGFLTANASVAENVFILGGTYVMPTALKNTIDEILHAARIKVSADSSKVHFIDVGQGDSELVELPNGQTMLIDAGTPQSGNQVANEIKSLGYSRIDYLVATHPHADHIGGMAEIINSFDIGEIYMPKVSTTTATYENLLDAIAAKGLSIHTAKAGVTIAADNTFSVQIISPMLDDYADINDWSAIIRYNTASKNILFTGDAGKDVIRDANPGKIDVLKVSHHGSRTGTDEALATELSPAYAVISCGLNNSYGHPHEEVLDALKGTQLYRTDLQGTIDMTIDANGISIASSKNNELDTPNLLLAA
ncbi:cell wall-binding repeat-containing protein [Senegalimassilia anaerobia]|uniref:cell wall-binding repeat-containing protein n=1 Tax=Senegalimassilia anaerobia TaxID=1473216 RepID=UPI0026E9587D|nr:cell wall-binding repeat-containing protein [Senegalimassilia anaerobia]